MRVFSTISRILRLNKTKKTPLEPIEALQSRTDELLHRIESAREILGTFLAKNKKDPLLSAATANTLQGITSSLDILHKNLKEIRKLLGEIQQIILSPLTTQIRHSSMINRYISVLALIVGLVSLLAFYRTYDQPRNSAPAGRAEIEILGGLGSNDLQSFRRSLIHTVARGKISGDRYYLYDYYAGRLKSAVEGMPLNGIGEGFIRCEILILGSYVEMLKFDMGEFVDAPLLIDKVDRELLHATECGNQVFELRWIKAELFRLSGEIASSREIFRELSRIEDEILVVDLLGRKEASVRDLANGRIKEIVQTTTIQVPAREHTGSLDAQKETLQMGLPLTAKIAEVATGEATGPEINQVAKLDGSQKGNNAEGVHDLQLETGDEKPQRRPPNDLGQVTSSEIVASLAANSSEIIRDAVDLPRELRRTVVVYAAVAGLSAEGSIPTEIEDDLFEISDSSKNLPCLGNNSGIDFSPTRPDRLAFACGKKVLIWQFDQNALFRESEVQSYDVIDVSYHPSGEYVASLTASGEIKIWYVPNQLSVGETFTSPLLVVEEPPEVRFDADSRLAPKIRFGPNGRLLSIQPAAKEPVRILEHPFATSRKPFLQLKNDNIASVSLNAELIAVANSSGRIDIIGLSTQKRLTRFETLSGSLSTMTLSPKSDLLAVTDGSILEVWEGVKKKGNIRFRQTRPNIKKIVFDPSLSHIALLDVWGNVDVLDEWTGRLVLSISNNLDDEVMDIKIGGQDSILGIAHESVIQVHPLNPVSVLLAELEAGVRPLEQEECIKHLKLQICDPAGLSQVLGSIKK